MRREAILIIFFFIFRISAFAQFGPQQIVTNEAYQFPRIITVDLDGDGDLDILSAESVVAWYENMDGLGQFSNQKIIEQGLEDIHPSEVTASDLDGDGDVDVICCFLGDPYVGFGEKKIVWNENLDGQGNFGVQQVITLDFDAVFTIIPCDFDNDSDMDLLIIDRNDDKLFWLENMDGLGNFGNEHLISFDLEWPINGAIGDIDNDGDMDVLSHSYDEDKIAWFENLDGQGTFSVINIISTDVDKPRKVFLADIDMDTDMDVVSTSNADNKIFWYENMDGQGTFGTELLITSDILYPGTLYVEDLDNDGDNDILSSFWESGKGSGFVWCENNDGSGFFEPPQLISDEVDYPCSVIASDIDNDNDMDILSSSHFDQKIAWYENQTILGVDENSPNNIILYPNPSNDVFIINGLDQIESIRLYSMLGILIKEFNTPICDVSQLTTGMYLIHISSENGIHTTRFVKN